MATYDLGTARGKIDIDASGAKRGARQAKEHVGEYNKELNKNEKQSKKTGKANKDLTSSFLGASAGAASLVAVFNLVKIPLIVQGITAAIGAIGALAGASIQLVAALGPLVGLLPAVAGGALAMGQAFGVAKLAFGGIGGALKAISAQEKSAGASSASAAKSVKAAAQQREAAAERIADAEKSLARTQRQAAESIEDAIKAVSEAQKDRARVQQDAADSIKDALSQIKDAERTLADAQKFARDAQSKLNDARREARDRLDDLSRSIERASISEERATLRLADAQRVLGIIEGAGITSGRRHQEALLDVRDAEVSLAEAQDNRQDIAKELADAQKKGIAGSDAVVSVNEEIASANESVIDAQKSLIKASLDLQKTQASAAESILAANESVRDSEEALADTRVSASESVSDAQENLTRAIRDSTSAMDDMGASANKAEDAMKDLSPAARALVTTLVAMKAPFKQLKEAAQAALFPGVISALNKLMPLFAVFTPVVVGTAAALGTLADKAASLMASPAFSGRLVAIGNNNIGVITGLGDAFLNLLTPILTIIQAAQPLIDQLVATSIASSAAFGSLVSGAEASGGLAAFFTEAGETSKTFSSILKQVSLIFYDVGRAAYDSGKQMLVAWDQGLQKFREMTSSVQGQNAMKDWFEAIQPAVNALGALLSDLSSGLVGLFGELTPAIAPVIEQIRTQFLPALLDLFGKMDGDFLSTIVTLATTLVEFANIFMTSTPVLSLFLKVLEQVVGAAVGLFHILGPLGPVLVNLIAAFSAYKTVSLAVGTFKKFHDVVGKLRGLPSITSLIRSLANGSALAAVKMKLLAAGTLAQAAATKVAVVAAAAFNAVMALNPIALIVIAIAAVVAALVALYFHFEPFREFIDAIWQKIQQVVDWITEKLGQFIDWLSKVPEKVAEIVGKIITKFVEWKDKIGELIGNVARFFAELPGKIFSAIGDLGGKLLAFGKLIIEKLVEGVKSAAGSIWDFFTGIPKQIIGFFANIGSWLLQAGRDLVMGFIDGIKNMARSVVTALIGLLPGPLKKFASMLGLSSPSKLFFGFGTDTLQGFINGLHDQLGPLRSEMAKAAELMSLTGSPGVALSSAAGAGLIGRTSDAGARGGTTTDQSVRYGDANVYVETNADAKQISSEIVWSRRIEGIR